MAYRRRYRRKRSMVGEMLADTTHIANRLSWKGSAILGLTLFAIFYWLLPAWLAHELNTLEGNKFKPVVEVVFAKRIHWIQWLGIALGLICAFFTIRNHFTARHLDPNSERDVSFFSRFLARLLD